ncbi:MAG: hypothetical protein ABL876_14235 [Chitinophagaceae bacterium]
MKKIKHFFCLAAGALFITASVQAQNQSGVDSTGLPGDNFSLQGALQLFQDAASPEAFEEAINKEGNHVNNLDLDGDGDIDYVKVVSKKDDDAHVFILQVAISEKETQDIAVIELEKTGKESAVIQIVGDEDIYGEQIIIEPDSGGADAGYNNYSNNSNLSGPNAEFENEIPGIVVNVWIWPSVRFVYGPGYRPWVSPWRWHYYPAWWKPWKPFAWKVWHPFRVHYHRPFVVVHTHRVIHAHRVYTPYRTTSVAVRTRHSTCVNNYRVTRSRTTVTGPRGKTTTVKKTTVTGPRGGKATKVKVRRH